MDKKGADTLMMNSNKLVSGIVAGSLIGATVGYMMRPRKKAMSMVRKNLKRMF